MSPRRNAKFSIEAARSLLRGSGLRCTAARLAVIQTLGDASTPLSPSEVAEELSDFGFDKSTIYRSLTEMDEAGLATRLDMGDAIRRFELRAAYDENDQRHPHFMCVDCGKVSCLSGFQVELVPKQAGDSPPGECLQILIKGRCRHCQ